MAEHSPEPWAFGGVSHVEGLKVVFDDNGDDVLVPMLAGHIVPDKPVWLAKPDDIARAVACVNAMRGVPTEALEAAAASAGEMELFVTDGGRAIHCFVKDIDEWAKTVLEARPK